MDSNGLGMPIEDDTVDAGYEGMTPEQQEAEYARRLLEYEMKKREYEETMAEYEALQVVNKAAAAGASSEEQKRIYEETKVESLIALGKQSADYEASTGYQPPQHLHQEVVQKLNSLDKPFSEDYRLSDGNSLDDARTLPSNETASGDMYPDIYPAVAGLTPILHATSNSMSYNTSKNSSPTLNAIDTNSPNIGTHWTSTTSSPRYNAANPPAIPDDTFSLGSAMNGGPRSPRSGEVEPEAPMDATFSSVLMTEEAPLNHHVDSSVEQHHTDYNISYPSMVVEQGHDIINQVPEVQHYNMTPQNHKVIVEEAQYNNNLSPSSQLNKLEARRIIARIESLTNGKFDKMTEVTSPEQRDAVERMYDQQIDSQRELLAKLNEGLNESPNVISFSENHEAVAHYDIMTPVVNYSTGNAFSVSPLQQAQAPTSTMVYSSSPTPVSYPVNHHIQASSLTPSNEVYSATITPVTMTTTPMNWTSPTSMTPQYHTNSPLSYHEQQPSNYGYALSPTVTTSGVSATPPLTPANAWASPLSRNIPEQYTATPVASVPNYNSNVTTPKISYNIPSSPVSVGMPSPSSNHQKSPLSTPMTTYPSPSIPVTPTIVTPMPAYTTSSIPATPSVVVHDSPSSIITPVPTNKSPAIVNPYVVAAAKSPVFTSQSLPSMPVHHLPERSRQTSIDTSVTTTTVLATTTRPTLLGSRDVLGNPKSGHMGSIVESYYGEGQIVSENRYKAASNCPSLYNPRTNQSIVPIESILGGDIHSTRYLRNGDDVSRIHEARASVHPGDQYIMSVSNGSVPHNPTFNYEIATPNNRGQSLTSMRLQKQMSTPTGRSIPQSSLVFSEGVTAPIGMKVADTMIAVTSVASQAKSESMEVYPKMESIEIQPKVKVQEEILYDRQLSHSSELNRRLREIEVKNDEYFTGATVSVIPPQGEDYQPFTPTAVIDPHDDHCNEKEAVVYYGEDDNDGLVKTDTSTPIGVFNKSNRTADTTTDRGSSCISSNQLSKPKRRLGCC